MSESHSTTSTKAERNRIRLAECEVIWEKERLIKQTGTLVLSNATRRLDNEYLRKLGVRFRRKQARKEKEAFENDICEFAAEEHTGNAFETYEVCASVVCSTGGELNVDNHITVYRARHADMGPYVPAYKSKTLVFCNYSCLITHALASQKRKDLPSELEQQLKGVQEELEFTKYELEMARKYHPDNEIAKSAETRFNSKRVKMNGCDVNK